MQPLYGTFIALRSRLLHPVASFLLVAFHAIAKRVLETKMALGFSISLLGSYSVPIKCLFVLYCSALEYCTPSHACAVS